MIIVDIERNLVLVIPEEDILLNALVEIKIKKYLKVFE
jgi:hypothetical protein